RCAVLRCCGCVCLPPIIFIGTHSLALVETDLTKIFITKDVCYGCLLWMIWLLSIHCILDLRIFLVQLLCEYWIDQAKQIMVLRTCITQWFNACIVSALNHCTLRM
ncbi:hypothetical protein SFRURICE_013675, partial [Spodoptera frugiperda]